MSELDRDDGVSRRKVLECMTWVGTGVLWTISGGVPHSLGLIDEAAAQEAHAPDLPADQRQPYRLRLQDAVPECARHARGVHRQGQCVADKARLHDPHRRHQPLVDWQRSSTTPTKSSRRPGSTFTTCPASTISSIRSRSFSCERYGQRHQGRRLVQLRRQRRALHRRSSTSTISRRAGSAISAPSSSNGSKPT